MATHRDVVERAAFRIGLRRAGQQLEGSIYTELLSSLEDYLLELDEEYPLDFDPTDANAVPAERMGLLVPLYMYTPVFDQFDKRRAPEARLILESNAKRKFFAAVVGDSDFVDEEPRNY